MKRDIRLQRVYPHPPELVWKAITDGGLIERWMQMETDFVPEVGHKFALRDISGNWGGTMNCEVTLVDPPSQLAYLFKGGVIKHDTVVTLTLVAEADGTRLKLDHTGFTGLSEIVLSGIIGLGWRRMLSVLSITLSKISTQ